MVELIADTGPRRYDYEIVDLLCVPVPQRLPDLIGYVLWFQLVLIVLALDMAAHSAVPRNSAVELHIVTVLEARLCLRSLSRTVFIVCSQGEESLHQPDKGYLKVFSYPLRLT